MNRPDSNDQKGRKPAHPSFKVMAGMYFFLAGMFVVMAFLFCYVTPTSTNPLLIPKICLGFAVFLAVMASILLVKGKRKAQKRAEEKMEEEKGYKPIE